MFTTNQNKSPWITRSEPNWGNDLIDFLMFGSKIIGNSAPTIGGKVSAIRFWRIIAGYPDFTLGGGRYRQVLKALKKTHKIRRKLPVNHDMLTWLCGGFLTGAEISSGRFEIVCAILVGFFYCLRISELERLTWGKLVPGVDIDGDATLTLSSASSKTDQFNEGATKVLKTLQSDLRPVRMLSRWGTMTTSRTNPKALVSGPHLRTRLAATLRLAGVECDVDGSRLGTHSMRSGGASAMFTVVYEVEVTMRWGRWSSSHFQSYIWKDHYVISSIGRGALMSLPIQSLERGRAGGGRNKGKGKC